MLIIWHDAYGPVIYKADTQERLEAAIFEIIRIRIRFGYFPDYDVAFAEQILERKDLRAASNFLMQRNGCEYERIEYFYPIDATET